MEPPPRGDISGSDKPKEVPETSTTAHRQTDPFEWNTLEAELTDVAESLDSALACAQEREKELLALLATTRNLPSPPPSKTGLIYDDRMTKHARPCGLHPERPARILKIHKKLQDKGLFPLCHVVPCRLAVEEEILTCHTPLFWKSIKETGEDDWERIIADTYFNEHSVMCAQLAAGGLLALTEKVVKGELDNGFAIIRPPGHHATSSEFMGFCILSNVAIAARVAQQRWGVQRVLIVDWDVHHGNGTQEIFYQDDGVVYFSVHRGGAFYPGTGFPSEVGDGHGIGKTVNVPIPASGVEDSDVLCVIRTILLPIAKEFDPELVLVSAGFDAAKGDPLGHWNLSSACFAHMTHTLKTLAKGKVVMALEGGYNLNATSDAAAATIGTAGPPLPSVSIGPISRVAFDSISATLEHQKEHWKILENFILEEEIQQPSPPDQKRHEEEGLVLNLGHLSIAEESTQQRSPPAGLVERLSRSTTNKRHTNPSPIATQEEEMKKEKEEEEQQQEQEEEKEGKEKEKEEKESV